MWFRSLLILYWVTKKSKYLFAFCQRPNNTKKDYELSIRVKTIALELKPIELSIYIIIRNVIFRRISSKTPAKKYAIARVIGPPISAQHWPNRPWTQTHSKSKCALGVAEIDLCGYLMYGLVLSYVFTIWPAKIRQTIRLILCKCAILSRNLVKVGR